MNVSEILDLTHYMAFGSGTSTAKEKERYLLFLNLADCELYEIAAAQNYFLRTDLDVFLTVGTDYITKPADTFSITKISNGQVEFKLEKESTLKIPSYSYIRKNGRIYTDIANLYSKADPDDGISKKYLTLETVPNRKILVEHVADADTELDAPLYPTTSHRALIEGTLYYLFESIRGLEQRALGQYPKWEKAKRELANIYINGGL